jgi:uncharacterized membrane protein YjgN (DUF898 family)
VRFLGSGSEYFRIWIVNLLLILVTLGLYYPYAKVRRLKYFHNATEVGGFPLSFHAEPGKMLRGYLLVALMLAAYSAAGHFSATAGLVAFVIVAGLWPALWHSSLRFRMANTGWRGLRLRFTGTRGGAYAALAPGMALAFLLLLAAWWAEPAAGPAAAAAAAEGEQPESPVAALVGIGLAFGAMVLLLPVLLWLMRRYQHRHFALGPETTRFDVGAGAFYGLVLRAAGLGLLLALLGSAAMGAVLWAIGPPADPDSKSLASLVIALFMLALAFAVNLAVLPYFTARQQNLVWPGTHSAHVRFESRLRYRPLLGLTLKNWLLIAVTLGLYLPFAAIATARMRLEAVNLHLTVDPETLVAQALQAHESAAGDAAGDLLGLDIGL